MNNNSYIQKTKTMTKTTTKTITKTTTKTMTKTMTKTTTKTITKTTTKTMTKTMTKTTTTKMMALFQFWSHIKWGMELSAHRHGNLSFRLNVSFTFTGQTLITVPIHAETKKPIILAPERCTRWRMDLPANPNLFHITVRKKHPHRVPCPLPQTIPPRLHTANQ